MAQQRTINAEIYPKDDGYIATCPELSLAIEGATYDQTLQELEMAVDRKLAGSAETDSEHTQLKITGEKPPYPQDVEVRIFPTLEGYRGELYFAGGLVASCDIKTQKESFQDMVLKKLREVAPIEVSSHKWVVSIESSPIPRVNVERISVDPAVCHGRPCIKGTRVMVSVIFDCLADGMPEKEILQQYPSLKVGDVQAAMEYAAVLEKAGTLDLVR